MLFAVAELLVVCLLAPSRKNHWSYLRYLFLNQRCIGTSLSEDVGYLWMNKSQLHFGDHLVAQLFRSVQPVLKLHKVTELFPKREVPRSLLKRSLISHRAQSLGPTVLCYTLYHWTWRHNNISHNINRYIPLLWSLRTSWRVQHCAASRNYCRGGVVGLQRSRRSSFCLKTNTSSITL